MTPEEIQKQLDQASRCYNDGLYDQATALWNAVLAIDPQNARAREGVQMAELLTKDWGEDPPGVEAATHPESTATPPAPVAENGEAQVQEALQRVEELLSAGDFDGAREGVEVLMQIAPDNEAVQACAVRLESGTDPEGYVEEQLSLARHYIMMGEAAGGAEACRRALAVAPDNDEAKELLSQAGSPSDGLDPAATTPGAVMAPEAVAPSQPEAPAPEAPIEEDEGFLNFDLEDFNAEPAGAAGPVVDAMPMGEPDLPPADTGTPEERIAALLAQGDALNAEGKIQDAIQVWSRVFILDDNNAEAEGRVEGARKALEEQAGQVDELRYRGEDLLKSGQLAEAQVIFEQILGILPNHQEAKDYLNQIEQRLAGGGAASPTDLGAGDEVLSVPLVEPEVTPESIAAEMPSEESVPLESPMPEAAAPPMEAATMVPTPPPAPAAARKGRGPLVLALGGIVLVGVLGYGGYMAWQVLFPSGPSMELGALEPQPLNINGTAPAPAPVGVAAEPVADAPLDAAAPIAVTPDKVEPVIIDTGDADEAVDLVLQGAKQFEVGRYDEALDFFRAALSLDPGNMDAKDWELRAANEVEGREKFEREIASVRAAFSDYDYETALKKLYRVESPTQAGEARVRQWTATCWYNWGVLRLQSGRMKEAREKFEEALELVPGDEETENHLEVIRRYNDRSLDSTFKAYSDSVVLRALE